MNLSNIKLVGESTVFLKALDEASLIAALNKPVLIVGERGTGKELFASRIHYLSPRWESVYIQLNCASLNETLLETELFGHEAGSFTGATRRHQGRFERAHTGTLFLDELATTSTRVQEKILRVIEYGQFERVGGSNPVTTNVRIVAATNEDLPSLAKTGKFRIDLLDRLAFDVITLPPLREREGDILLLAEHFGVAMASELQLEVFQGFTSSAQTRMEEYEWPGNIRELKNVVERAVYRSLPDKPIDEIVFDPFDSPYRPGLEGASLKTSADTMPTDLKQAVRDFEIKAVQEALRVSNFVKSNAAARLGLTRNQLANYLKKYELEDKAEPQK